MQVHSHKSKSHLLASRHMVYMYKRDHWCVVYGLDAIVGWQGGKIKASIYIYIYREMMLL